MKIVIEIPKDSFIKYEIKDGVLIADRELTQPLPFNYGYIVNTLAGDGDPLDVFLIANNSITSCTAVTNCVVVGAFICTDNGEEDNKIICTFDGNEMRGVDKHEICYFLSTYKPGFVVVDYVGPEEAKKLIEKCNFVL